MKHRQKMMAASLLCLIPFLPMHSTAGTKSATKAKTTAKKAKVLTNADNGKAVTLKTGDTLTVRLEENKSTGYSWAYYGHVWGDPKNKKMPVKLTKDESIAPKGGGAGKAAGRPGIHEFQFKTTGDAGKVVLVFVYSQPWIEDKTGADEWRVTVTVPKKTS